MGYQADKAGPKAPGRRVLLPGFMYAGEATFPHAFCRGFHNPVLELNEASNLGWVAYSLSIKFR